MPHESANILYEDQPIRYHQHHQLQGQQHQVLSPDKSSSGGTLQEEFRNYQHQNVQSNYISNGQQVASYSYSFCQFCGPNHDCQCHNLQSAPNTCATQQVTGQSQIVASFAPDNQLREQSESSQQQTISVNNGNHHHQQQQQQQQQQLIDYNCHQQGHYVTNEVYANEAVNWSNGFNQQAARYVEPSEVVLVEANNRGQCPTYESQDTYRHQNDGSLMSMNQQEVSQQTSVQQISELRKVEQNDFNNNDNDQSFHHCPSVNAEAINQDVHLPLENCANYHESNHKMTATTNSEPINHLNQQIAYERPMSTASVPLVGRQQSINSGQANSVPCSRKTSIDHSKVNNIRPLPAFDCFQRIAEDDYNSQYNSINRFQLEASQSSAQDQYSFPTTTEFDSIRLDSNIDFENSLEHTKIQTGTSKSSRLNKQSGRRGRPRKKNQRSKYKVNGKLWEFIRDLLLNETTNPSFIRWERREDGVFKFVQSDKVAKMWGERKQNPKMTYEKLSRAMRYYYKSRVLLPVFGRRLVYKFGPNATGWKAAEETRASTS